MNRAVTPEIMGRIEKQTYGFYGIPEMLLMEQAGILGWERIISLYGKELVPGGKILFVAGSGNNGGDAMVMARRARQQGFSPEVLLATESQNELSTLHKTICDTLDIPLIQWAPGTFIPDSYLMVVDGLVGSGLSGALRTPLDELVDELNGLRGVKIAIDMPSGIATDGSWFIADTTLAMGFLKEELFLPNSRGGCGALEVISLDFPESLVTEYWNDGTEVLGIDDIGVAPYQLPEVDKTAYKSIRGHVAVFGGSPGLLGAPRLAVRSITRSHAGRVTLFVDDELFPLVQREQKAEIIRTVEDYLSYSLEQRKSLDAVILGPGWGRNHDRVPLLSRVIQSQSCGIIDADGIPALKEAFYQGELTVEDTQGKWIITPHMGEFVEFSGIPKGDLFVDPRPHLRAMAEEFGVIIVLKSHVTWIATPQGKLRVIDGMNPALGTSGSGDVLAGVIGAILSQGVQPDVAAALGVMMHQSAGHALFDRVGWFDAYDLSQEVFPKE